MEGLLGPHMDVHSKQILEILNQPGMVHKTPARFPGDQQIEVAIFVGFIARHGAEHTQAVRATLPDKPEDLLSAFRAQRVQGHHVSIVRQKEFRPPILETRCNGTPRSGTQA
jgi:hypothetical protein